jgi:hypothetical protein
MEVRDWLKCESDDGKKSVKQIVFAGERFDVMSGLRLVGTTQPRSGRAPHNFPLARRCRRASAPRKLFGKTGARSWSRRDR